MMPGLADQQLYIGELCTERTLLLKAVCDENCAIHNTLPIRNVLCACSLEAFYVGCNQTYASSK